jgi:hypothetical protein
MLLLLVLLTMSVEALMMPQLTLLMVLSSLAPKLLLMIMLSTRSRMLVDGAVVALTQAVADDDAVDTLPHVC